MTLPQSRLAWLRGYTSRAETDTPGVQVASYRLSDLVNRGYISPSSGRGLLMDAGLIDFVWRVMWVDSSPTPDAELEYRLGGAEGYVVFMHGWTGNYAIWEQIPVAGRDQQPAILSPSASITTVSARPRSSIRRRWKCAIRPPPCASSRR